LEHIHLAGRKKAGLSRFVLKLN